MTDSRKLLYRSGVLAVLSGPSGVGKNTVLNRLLTQRTDLRYSISVTTRPPRRGEKDGQHYFFVDREKFRQLVDQGELLEWAEVYGHYYGTPRRFIEDCLSSGYSVVLDVDPQGAAQIRQKVPDGVFIFLMPPSWEALEQRIRSRGADSEETIVQRLTAAQKELAAVAEYDYVVLNDDLDRAVEDLSAIVSAETRRVTRTDYRRFLRERFNQNHYGEGTRP
ncbi:MAG: guanylate kinase [Bacillota bacterium]|nr:guanylate kinase [Bacillota bacterium]